MNVGFRRRETAVLGTECVEGKQPMCVEKQERVCVCVSLCKTAPREVICVLVKSPWVGLSCVDCPNC